MIVESREADHFVSHDGTKLFKRSWETTKPKKATVFFIHGLGDHIGRYEELFSHFSDNGIEVYGFDHRGHGQSISLNPGKMKQGHLGEFDCVHRDIRHFMDLHRDEQGIPRFIMGHSMGGLIALDFALKSENCIDGVISSSPAIQVGTPVPFYKRFACRTFLPIIPSFTLSNSLDPTNISRIPEVVEDYKSDILCHPRISLRTAASIIDTGNRLHKGENLSIKCPVLIVHGSADTMTSFEASQKFIEKLDASDKEFKSFSGGYHCLHNDLVKEEVTKLYTCWILEKSQILTKN